jgi:hypothetical protein
MRTNEFTTLVHKQSLGSLGPLETIRVRRLTAPLEHLEALAGTIILTVWGESPKPLLTLVFGGCGHCESVPSGLKTIDFIPQLTWVEFGDRTVVHLGLTGDMPENLEVRAKYECPRD